MMNFADGDDLEKIIVGVGMEYSFDQKNPTGHYRAKLDEEDDRNLITQLINISNEEKKQREDMGLVDTSQHGMADCSSFRNVFYNRKRLKVMFGRENPLPKVGFLELDFVRRGLNSYARTQTDQLPATLTRELSDEFEEECRKLKKDAEKARQAGSATVDRVQLVMSIRRWLKRCDGWLDASDVVRGLHALGILPAFVMCKLCSKDGQAEGEVGLGAHYGNPAAPPRPVAHGCVPCQHPSLCEGCARSVKELGMPVCCPICTKWSDKTVSLSCVVTGAPRTGLQTAQAMMDSIHQTVETNTFTLFGTEKMESSRKPSSSPRSKKSTKRSPKRSPKKKGPSPKGMKMLVKLPAQMPLQLQPDTDYNDDDEPLIAGVLPRSGPSFDDEYIDQGPGWMDAGDRAVAIEFIVTCYSRVVSLGALCTDAIGWFFNDQERHTIQQRLGPLNIINPMMPDGYWELNLKFHDDREVATMLVLLAVGEPGENWRDEKFGDVMVNNGVKTLREPRSFELPATWEKEVPSDGLLQLHYYTSERWVDRELRAMLQGRCLVGEENQNEEEEEQEA